MGERGPEVEMDADDPVAVPGEREGGGLAHPARAAEDERDAAVPGLVLHIVAREVAQGEGVRRALDLAGARGSG